MNSFQFRSDTDLLETLWLHLEQFDIKPLARQLPLDDRICNLLGAQNFQPVLIETVPSKINISSSGCSTATTHC